ncbi:MAG: hypothetical protein LC733_06930, partial [Actinobacteria bacterium]|nr:hypothetical protein [Actinomycetota bacterium]
MTSRSLSLAGATAVRSAPRVTLRGTYLESSVELAAAVLASTPPSAPALSVSDAGVVGVVVPTH